MRTYRFHPWNRMRDLGPAWKLDWSESLPWDVYGHTDFAKQTITLRSGMSFEERRCTITHEIEHVLRGPASTCSEIAEELHVNRRSSRLLLCSVKEITDAMMWNHGNYEGVATDLWVDPWMLEVRLGTLRPSELRYYDRRMADVALLG